MPNQISGRPTWAEINLDNLTSNFMSVKNFINQQIEFMAVVKADAYGHCAVECAKRLEIAGVDWFGVALPEEALELRQNGITKPILCLGGFWVGQEKMLLENNLTPVIFQWEKAELLDRAAKEFGLTVKAHIKIDTGMGRIGIRFDEIDFFIEKVKSLKNVRFDGIMTHFAAADSFAERNFTNLQIERFNQTVAIFERDGFDFSYKDSANSPASLAYPDSYGNLVRLGGILYGLGDDVLPDWIDKPEIKPVLSLFSKITYLKKIKKGETLGYGRTFQAQRDSVIATIPIGYQDGLRRILSNRGRVIINGHYAEIVGRISMDWTMLDVTEIPGVKIGDRVVLIGEQDDLKITVEEIAEQTDTISYEITCGIDRRVGRIYVGSE
ncbi:alanine racemase [soil metagenome]